MPIPHALVAIGSWIGVTASRIVANVAGKILTKPNKPSSVATKGKTQVAKRGDDQLRKAEGDYLRGKAKREQELVNIQADLAKMREIEVEAGMAIAAAQAEREERALEISERELQLKQQTFQLAKQRLKQEGQIAETQRQQVERALELRERELQILAEERAEKIRLSYLHLQILQQNKAIEIDLHLNNIQANWDQENWSGVLSRAEMKQILLEGREKPRLLMLVSPPDIEGCPEFDIKFHKNVRGELKSFIENYYPLDSDLCPVEFYGRFFKKSVFDIEVKQYEKDLAPIPTVIIYSDVTDKKIFFYIHYWGFVEGVPLTLSWNWREERDKLETEGKTRDESNSIIRDAIVKIHQLLAAFWSDLYYLQINPHHEVRLFQLNEEFPAEWVQIQFETLKNFQQERLASYRNFLITLENKETINLSDPLPPVERLAVKMGSQSKIIERGSPIICKLPLTEDMRDPNKMISRCHIGQPSFPPTSEKVLMVVGATGAGKSTLINGMVNYILGVDWKDDFRFKMIVDEGGKSQAHSQTKLVTAYTIHEMEGSPLPYTLTIIDTPGFRNTEGLKRDKFITNQIKEFFSAHSGIDHLDGIGFVTPSYLARLTPIQQYIFDSILSIFGKNVASNIFMMITFADGLRPPVMDTIEEAKIPYSKFFKFNNSALFAKNELDEDDEDENFDTMLWKMAFKSFQEFFTNFEQADSISLQLTKDVLKERQQLEATIQGLQPRINAGLSKLEEIRQEEKDLEQQKAEIEANVESMIANMNSYLEGYLEGVAEDVFSMIQQVQQSLSRLDQIALKPDPLTQEEHLELLIDSEKQEKKPGWAQRVADYEEAKKQAQILSKMRNDENLKNKPKANFKYWVDRLRFW